MVAYILVGVLALCVSAGLVLWWVAYSLKFENQEIERDW